MGYCVNCNTSFRISRDTKKATEDGADDIEKYRLMLGFVFILFKVGV